MNFRKLLPLLCLAVLAFPAPLHAQAPAAGSVDSPYTGPRGTLPNPYARKNPMPRAGGSGQNILPNSDRYGSGFDLDPNGVPYSSKYWEGLPGDNVIALVRKPELTEDQFILRITDRNAITGCAEISDYGFETEYRDIYLDINILGLTVDMRDQPKYAHFQCNQHMQIPTADIVMNRQDLVKNETQQIRMHNENDTNYYNVKLYDNRVMILPDPSDVTVTRRFKPHGMPGKYTSLVYWFYPLGTIMLWVPGEEATPEIIGWLRAFAQEKGLTPLETVYKDFESPMTSKKYQYFVDTAGTMTGNDPGLVDGKPIGAIATTKRIYGLYQDEYEPAEMVVYAKTPGMYE